MKKRMKKKPSRRTTAVLRISVTKCKEISLNFPHFLNEFPLQYVAASQKQQISEGKSEEIFMKAYGDRFFSRFSFNCPLFYHFYAAYVYIFHPAFSFCFVQKVSPLVVVERLRPPIGVKVFPSLPIPSLPLHSNLFT